MTRFLGISVGIVFFLAGLYIAWKAKEGGPPHFRPASYLFIAFGLGMIFLCLLPSQRGENK